MKIIKVLSIILTIPLSIQNVVADYSAGQEKSQVCAGCHGADGNSQITMYPRLGNFASFALKSMKPVPS